MSEDVSGSRFLRMAGSDEFQRKLNRSAQPTGTQNSSVGGTTAVNSGSSDYSMLIESPDTMGSTSNEGPGSFTKQTERDQMVRNEGPAVTSAPPSYSNFGTGTFGVDTANKYIQAARQNNPINIVALDKSIRSRPLYHEAKSKLEGLKTFGDVARWSREDLPEFIQPKPMEGVEAPDFDAIYEKSKNDLNSLKI